MIKIKLCEKGKFKGKTYLTCGSQKLFIIVDTWKLP